MPVGCPVAVFQHIVASVLVPYLHEDVGEVGNPLNDQEPFALAAQPVDQFGELLGACRTCRRPSSVSTVIANMPVTLTRDPDR
ncbi:hypothetical protein Skr01_32900 [Sphaerisporangium krabiense]|nr:hypothetical protein Skr01_32900 [Sphaerisporangium krabiense]